MKKKPFVVGLTLTLLMAWVLFPAMAQKSTECQLEYTVQSGDWLSKISEKYLGDVLAYPVIVEATNAQTDERFADIANPDLIEPGWLLCIPGTAGDQQPENTPPVDGLDIDPSQIRLDTQGLPYSWQAVTVPGTPYDQSQPPGPKGLPEHIEILFGVTNPADRQHSDPIMYIIPVDTYRLLWEEGGNDAVTREMNQIYDYTVSMPDPPPTSRMPVLPFEEVGGVGDVAVQVGSITPTDLSATKDGYRFVGRFAQDANPITSDGLPLRYIYQGFTNDGKYLVAFFYPVSSDSLPTNADVNEEFNQAMSQPGGAEEFVAKQVEMLNALPTSAWQPDLATLDTLVASLEIEEMSPVGLVGPVWEWQQTSMNDGSTFTPTNPADYTVQFVTDGQVAIKADCNQVGGSYTTDGSSINIELGPSTMAMCPPDSLSDQFLAGLSGAIIYFFQDANLYIDLKFDIGTMQFAPAGATDSASGTAPAETTDTATEFIVFDPDSFETDPNRAPVQGVCQASTYLPGAYQCATETGANLDPCFVRADGLLVCNPNPVFSNYTQLVTPSEPLPESSKTGDPVAFYLELAGNNPPCHVRTMGDDYMVAGKPVTYNCDAPAAWIVGPLDTSQPTWMGEYVITNPSGDEVTSGPTQMAIARAWVY